MEFENLIYAMMGAAIFGMGVAIGGIIEYNRSIKKINERDKFYLQIIKEITQMLCRIEDKIRIIHCRISHTTDELQKMKEALNRQDPDETQPINIWDRRERSRTPSMPYELSCEDYEDYED